MGSGRDSFDVRDERLNLLVSQSKRDVLGTDKLASPPTESDEVHDWIKSVRALKEKRQAEDEARNHQLEEDILRERNARQERRAHRSRSTSPTKNLASPLPEKAEQIKHLRLSPSTSIEYSNSKQTILPSSPIRETLTRPTSVLNRTSQTQSPKIVLKESEDTRNLASLSEKFKQQRLQPSARGQTLDKTIVDKTPPRGSPSSLGTEINQTRKTHESPLSSWNPTTPRGTIVSKLDVPTVLKTSRTFPIAHESRSKVSSRMHPNLGALLERKIPPLAEAEQHKSVVDSRHINKLNEPTELSTVQAPKLTHMTRDRARRKKGSSSNAVSSAKVSQAAEFSKSVPRVHDESMNSVESPSINRSKLMAGAISSNNAGFRSTGDRPPVAAKTLIAEVSKVRRMGVHVNQTAPSPDTTGLTQSLTPNPINEHDVLSPTPQKVPSIMRETAVRTPSLFKKSARSHSPTKSVMSLTGVADLIKSRADSLDMSPKPSSAAGRKIPTVSHVWSISASAPQFQSVTGLLNILNDDEVRVYKVAEQEICYAWIGLGSAIAYRDFLNDVVPHCKVLEIFATEESAHFLDLFPDKLIILKGTTTRDEPQLFAIRSYEGGLAVDEVSCTSSSLCSGFSFVLLGIANYIWLGKGCTPAESTAASHFLSIYRPATKFTTVAEGEESETFWKILGGKGRYASSAYWRLKRDVAHYINDMYTVEGQKVIKRKAFSQRSLAQGSVKILDTFFEIYILLNEGNRKEDIILASKWTRNFCRSLGTSRPFMPMTLVLCPGSKLPRDLRAVFRSHPKQDLGMLRVLELSAADSILQRSHFTLEEFAANMVIGVDWNNLDRHIDTKDFLQLLGYDRQSFDRLSAREQDEARNKARDTLSTSHTSFPHVG